MYTHAAAFLCFLKRSSTLLPCTLPRSTHTTCPTLHAVPRSMAAQAHTPHFFNTCVEFPSVSWALSTSLRQCASRRQSHTRTSSYGHSDTCDKTHAHEHTCAETPTDAHAHAHLQIQIQIPIPIPIQLQIQYTDTDFDTDTDTDTETEGLF